MTRNTITKKKLHVFMQSIGKILKKNAVFYLTGGSTAILFGIREGTIDIDIAGDMNELFSHIPQIKERLQINIELTKPTDFVPSLPDEKKRHILIGEYGKAIFMHFDLYSQVFSKIVRGHTTDIVDVKALIQKKMIDPTKLYQMVKDLPDHAFQRYPRLNRFSVEMAVKSIVKI